MVDTSFYMALLNGMTESCCSLYPVHMIYQAVESDTVLLVNSWTWKRAAVNAANQGLD